MICIHCHISQGLDATGQPNGLCRDFVKNTCICEVCWWHDDEALRAATERMVTKAKEGSM